MLVVTTMPYIFIINGEHTKFLKENRGLRHEIQYPLTVCACYGVFAYITIKAEEDPRLRLLFEINCISLT